MSAAQGFSEQTEAIRVVVFREGDLYVAQCLEFDIAAQGNDIESVLDRLELTLKEECALSLDGGGSIDRPFTDIPAAPNFFHGLWAKGSYSITRKHLPVDTADVRIDAVYSKAA